MPATPSENAAKDSLDSQHRDRATSVGKAVLGAIPFAGPLLTEIMIGVVPSLKEERLINYVRLINSRVEALEENQKQQARSNPNYLELIEDGALQAIRSTSDTRIEQISEIVAKGLERDEVSIVRRKRILRVFSQIDDDEVLILEAYGHSSAFGVRGLGVRKDPWAKVEKPERLSLNSKVSRDELEEQPLYEMGVSNLRNLGLLELKPKTVRKGEQIKFNTKTGEPEGKIQITRLGYMMLNEIGLLSEEHHYLRR